MVGTNDIPLLDLARGDPVRYCLFVGGPAILAILQLLNSYVNGLSLYASVPFAVVMVAFAVLYARHVRSVDRLRRMEWTDVRGERSRSANRR